MAAIRIRRLRTADYPDLVKLLDLAGLHPRTRGRESRRAFASQLRANRTLYLGAFERDRLVGCVLGTHDSRKGWINRLAVHPDYRRHGIASDLVRACEGRLRRLGIGIFAALIEGDNAASMRLFEDLGYTSTDIRYYRRKVSKEV